MSVTRTPSENEKNKEVITVSVIRRPSGSSELVVGECHQIFGKWNPIFYINNLLCRFLVHAKFRTALCKWVTIKNFFFTFTIHLEYVWIPHERTITG
jgi:hypothetical protein